MSKDLLLEVGTEDIPPRMLPPALEQLNQLAAQAFQRERIKFKQIKTFATHRRLVLLVEDLAPHQEDSIIETKGPPKKLAFDEKGNPTQTAKGFAKSQGISISDLVVKTIDQGEYVFAVKKVVGLPTLSVAQKILPSIITSLYFPKTMRWTDTSLRFARPIRWLLALYGSEKIPFQIDGIKSSNFSFGHRVLRPGKIHIKDTKEYFDRLRENFVLVSPEERTARIWEQAKNLAQPYFPYYDKNLLQELSYIFEFPTGFICRFEEKYLQLPEEVLISVLKDQRYIPTTARHPEKPERLMPLFIAFREGGEKHIQTIQEGNERVIKAKLADALFFFQKDQKTSLFDKVGKLKGVIYQEELGTLYDKAMRIAALGEFIADTLGLKRSQKESIQRAALLCKADLVTNMVVEFPDLQGKMGGIYAQRDGEKPAVWQAISWHYYPRSADDPTPPTQEGKIISLSDKLDAIVASFSLGLIPSGSEDPYGLRRNCQGIIQIIREANWRLCLPSLINASLEILQKSVKLKKSPEEIKNNLLELFRNRIETILHEEHIRHDIIEAVLSAGFDDIAVVFQRAQALNELAQKETEFEPVVTALTRVINIVRAAQTKYHKLRAEALKRSKKKIEMSEKDASEKAIAIPEEINLNLLSEPDEIALFEHYQKVREQIQKPLTQGDYRKAFYQLATLCPYINQFFDNVMVMVGGKTETNRLALLRQINNLLFKMADFSKIRVLSSSR